jgi:DNA adenine methylase
MDESVKSVIRWAGSKRKILPALKEAFIRSGASGRYIEPFAGSAAFFFELLPRKAVLSDTNPELISAWRRLKRDPYGLHEELSKLPVDEKSYYAIRSREGVLAKSLSDDARFFYLNRLCFNGIYRTNKKGAFNVPYGGEKSGQIPPLERWLSCSKALRGTRLIVDDFEQVILSEVRGGDFVYLDPPYAVSNRRVFKQYSSSEFGLDDLERLEAALIEIDRRGAKFLVSYAQSPETKRISAGWAVKRTFAQRNVAGFAKHRRKAVEVLISNF